MIRHVHSYILLPILCSCLFCACGPERSSVPFSAADSSSQPLYALNSSAMDGVLTASLSTAWFSFKTEKLKSQLDGHEFAVEVAVENTGSLPVSISLALITQADLTSRGALVSTPVSRVMSIVENASGCTHIRMMVPAKKTAPAVTGFVVQISSKSENRNESDIHAKITGASIVPVETGWQKSAQFFWAGFDSNGGRLETSRFSPVLLPSDSLLTLYFNAPHDFPALNTQQDHAVFSADSQFFSIRKIPSPLTVSIPALFFANKSVNVSLASGGENLAGMRVSHNKRLSVVDSKNNVSPISADPHMIIDWPQSSWRRSDYELFCWDRFPSILIFDTADYPTQDRLFKRLAFFTEKNGYKGKLWKDSDIASQHAYNAHDYRAESLASFFELARIQNFPLNQDEIELREILLSEGIIRKENSGYESGAGAVLSFSRASVSYLRYMFIAHEGYHGLYFIDSDFRAKVAEVYRSMNPKAIVFLETYFTVVGSLGYDTSDRYLMENEFMAYLMQQPLEKVGPYFTGTISERYIRYGGKPSFDQYVHETDAEEFIRAARDLNTYVYNRWGLAGGRIGLYFPN